MAVSEVVDVQAGKQNTKKSVVSKMTFRRLGT